MRWVRAGFLPVSLLTLVSAAFTVPLPLFVEQPGRSVSLDACVEVEHDAATPLAGDFLLMTINLLPSTAVDVVTSVFDDSAAVVLQHSIVPPGRDSEAFFRQQRELFADSADVAAAVGVRAAGFPVDVARTGVVVDRIEPGTPAEGVLRAGDVIQRVDGVEIEAEADLRDAVTGAAPGRPVRLELERNGDAVDATITPVEIEGRQVLGVHPVSRTRVELPFEVDVASGAVGGPSAGLTIALTVYDKVLPDVDLAAGRVVAGTGTLDLQGRVGPVGGAGLKVVAAERLGADLFLVPAQNLEEARRAASPSSGMQIVPVTTFEQARDVLVSSAGSTAAQPAPAGDCRAA